MSSMSPRPLALLATADDAADELVGYLHLKDVLETTSAGDDRRSPPRAAVHFSDSRRQPLTSQALALTQETGSHIAQVHDEHGVSLGIVMLEDIVQQLVGEFRAGPGVSASIAYPAVCNSTPGSYRPDSPVASGDSTLEDVPAKVPIELAGALNRAVSAGATVVA
jgi:CBS domain containing-hemolysin-like protein